ncbi:EscU/YscU/HrcU family type III secretion system export apparatus switch protein [Fuchsiella alkaliacetigena]|uniref:EscU/YscU/HrcU family type III secretion system export apparatus switch protein n=1 Tax=Fuchsiella alkaliacetigena TaxID=957042 RepID=UPI00200AB11A|nr:EscU/YscU/HrcU family type III secretion system export apparatus switch protein [Fuchsiella alkaliacetigena]MCK8823870.1 EscU/YscU/HrcU family type III secretion system export apparatus switch protein [Fuchsiella alkaliacetigena]
MSANKNKEKKKAVALKYDLKENEAPQVIAKGNQKTAQKIIEKAKENEIPIHKDPDLVENLIKLDLKEEIPEELYQVVAEVLSFIYQLDNKA